MSAPAAAAAAASPATAKVNLNDPPEIQEDELRLQKKVGEGSYGVVWSGRCRECPVAIKILRKRPDARLLAQFMEEVNTMRRVAHPNCVLFMGVCTSAARVALVTEYMDGCVEDWIMDKQKQIPLFDRLTLLLDGARGLTWLHGSSPTILHRDVKLGNLLYRRNPLIAKLADFGLASIMSGDVMRDVRRRGTPLYMSSEVLLGESFNASCDVYAFGCMLWEMLAREPIWSVGELEITSMELLIETVSTNRRRPPIPAGTLPSVVALINACWSHHPFDRPTMSEVVTRIEAILLELSLPVTDASSQSASSATAARDLWSKSFCGDGFKVSAPFSVFLQPFLRTQVYDKADEATLVASLKKVLLEDAVGSAPESDDRNVTIAAFGRIVAFFPPFNATLLARIHELVSKPYFCGNLTKTEAEARLLLPPVPPGTFLIRFSENAVGYFAIARMTDRGVQHVRVTPTADHHYQVFDSVYESVPAIVSAPPLSGPQLQLQLLHACPAPNTAASAYQGYAPSLP